MTDRMDFMRAAEETYLTARQVAERQHISPDTVKKALKAGVLRGQKTGARGDWRVAVSDYVAWVQAGAPGAPGTRREKTP